MGVETVAPPRYSGFMSWVPPAGLIAVFNLAAAACLAAGFYFIRRRRVAAHRACMLSAFALSLLFLVVYVWRHYAVGLTYFQRRGWIRDVYFFVLGTHTPLATIIVPLAIVTLLLGLSGRFRLHKRWARWTLPVWLYVSITGVVVYWMLYRL